MRLWNRARTAQEVAAACGRRLGPGVSGLVGYWSAEMGSSVDFSPTNNAATVSGSVMPSTDAPAVGAGNDRP